MTSSYMGKFLYVDLNKEEATDIPLPDWMAASYIGGKGFGIKFLYELLPRHTDPLSPENLLMFMTGPLTSTTAPSMRACAITKSPLTGTFLDSYFGGHFGAEIKFAGYDGLIITGKAAHPVYILTDSGKTEIMPASHMWGMDALEANHAIKDELDDESLKISTIGQAGENLVKFALISCEYNRQAGRGGAGAVMGSKNLKGVALKGDKTVKVYDLPGFKEAVKLAEKDLDESAAVQEMTENGTASAIPFANEAGLLPYRNYKEGQFDRSDHIGNKGQAEHIWIKDSACFGCPIRCIKMGAIRTGRYAGTLTEIVEYESAALMGSNLDIDDIKAVAYLVKLCDRLGLDSMSTGSVISFAMEAQEKGIIESPEGVKIEFGNVKATEYLIKSIANREGPLGDLLADGVKIASQKLGPESEKFAVHVKGLESPAWGPRGTCGIGLALMTADRGGCHQRGIPLDYEVGGEKWNGKPVDALSSEGKAEIVTHLQNYLAGTDTLVKCDFGGFGVTPANYARMLGAATGRNDASEELFDHVGERIWNLTRLFNIREGIDYTEDKLPPRFVDEPLPGGPNEGHRITQEDMNYMRSDYYKVRGWDERGIPTQETLDRLGLKEEHRFKLSRSNTFIKKENTTIETGELLESSRA